MQEDQSTLKADTTTSSHPDIGPHDPDTNPVEDIRFGYAAVTTTSRNDSGINA